MGEIQLNLEPTVMLFEMKCIRKPLGLRTIVFKIKCEIFKTKYESVIV